MKKLKSKLCISNTMFGKTRFISDQTESKKVLL